MSIRQRLEKERLRKIEAAAEEEGRDGRRRLVLTVLLLLFWTVLGLLIIGWGLHTTHPVYGPAALQAGALLANAGVLASLLWAYRGRR